MLLVLVKYFISRLVYHHHHYHHHHHPHKYIIIILIIVSVHVVAQAQVIGVTIKKLRSIIVEKNVKPLFYFLRREQLRV